nr:transposase [Clostridium massiliamazoniense]
MRMKENHMLNGKLKPAYNIQIVVASGYIVNFIDSQEKTDVNTLIPFLEDISKYHKYKNIVADAGYESLENYRYTNENGYKSYIKPNNY